MEHHVLSDETVPSSATISHANDANATLTPPTIHTIEQTSSAISRSPVVCTHKVWDFGNCARCGRPTCGVCTTGVSLIELAIRIPLVLCSGCTSYFQAIAASASAAVIEATVSCPAHFVSSSTSSNAASSPSATCIQCSAARIIARHRATQRAFRLLRAEQFFGEGERRTSPARAAAATLAAVPLVVGMGALSLAKGAVAGLVIGAFSGAAVGGAAGLDARNSIASVFTKPWFSKKSTTSARTQAGGASTTANFNTLAITNGKTATSHVSSDPGNAPVDGENNSTSDGTAASPNSNTSNPTGAGESTAAPAPVSASAQAIATAARAVLRMSPSERAANAEAELKRILACTTAYEILQLPRDASNADIKAVARAKALAYHPDRNDAPHAKECSQAINNAMSLLGDANKRASYDASGCSDTQGVDLFAGIKVTRSGVAAAVAGGVLGFAVGTVGGLVSGVLGGTLGGVNDAVTRSRAMASVSESAGTTVLRVIETRAAASETAAASSLQRLAATAHRGGNHANSQSKNGVGDEVTQFHVGPCAMKIEVLNVATGGSNDSEDATPVMPSPATASTVPSSVPTSISASTLPSSSLLVIPPPGTSSSRHIRISFHYIGVPTQRMNGIASTAMSTTTATATPTLTAPIVTASQDGNASISSITQAATILPPTSSSINAISASATTSSTTIDTSSSIPNTISHSPSSSQPIRRPFRMPNILETGGQKTDAHETSNKDQTGSQGNGSADDTSTPDFGTQTQDTDAIPVINTAFIERVTTSLSDAGDKEWMAHLLKDTATAAAAMRQAAGLPPVDAENDGNQATHDTAMTGSSYEDVAQTGFPHGLQPPKSALGFIWLAKSVASTAMANTRDVAAVQAWQLLARMYECWSAGVEIPPELAAAAEVEARKEQRADAARKAEAAAAKIGAAAVAEAKAAAEATEAIEQAKDEAYLRDIATRPLPVPVPKPPVDVADCSPCVRIFAAVLGPSDMIASVGKEGSGGTAMNAGSGLATNAGNGLATNAGSGLTTNAGSGSPGHRLPVLAPRSTSHSHAHTPLVWHELTSNPIPVLNVTGNTVDLPIMRLRSIAEDAADMFTKNRGDAVNAVSMRVRICDAGSLPSAQGTGADYATVRGVDIHTQVDVVVQLRERGGASNDTTTDTLIPKTHI